MISLSERPSSMKDARESITASLLNNVRICKVQKSDSSRYVLVCTEASCDFRIMAAKHSKSDAITVSLFKPHICLESLLQE